MFVLPWYQQQHGLDVDASLPLPPAPHRPVKDEYVFGGMAGLIGACCITNKAQSEMCNSMPQWPKFLDQLTVLCETFFALRWLVEASAKFCDFASEF